jgi:Flp pilus assembly protein TadD
MDTASGGKRGRNRGVRASRDKVNQAMVAAGFTSNKALINEMIKREGLEKDPTSLVRKVLAEKKVERLRLARVASVLGVDMQSLYHEKQDDEPVADISTTLGTTQEPSEAAQSDSKPPEPLLDPVSPRTPKRSRSWLLATGVLGLLVLATAAWYILASRSGARSLAARTANAMRDFRQAQSFLDSSPNELNLRRAQGHLEAALRSEPSFGAAAALLCETLLRQSWSHDEAGSLKDAETVCDRARALAPDALETKLAYAHLLLKKGRAADSAALLGKLLLEQPDHRDALLLESQVLIEQFQQTGERPFALEAQHHARHAVEIAPQYWKTHWQAGRAAFELGQYNEAVRSYKQAALLHPNEYVLSNLGSVTFCTGDVQGARDAYMQARRVTGNPNLGEEQLGMFYYYAGAFQKSLDARRSVISSFNSADGPEIHQIWGDLGDSYRRLDRSTEAIDSYRRAVQIVDQDLARGIATAGDRAYRAYYQIAASRSGASLPIPDGLRTDLEQIGDITEPGALVRIAVAWRLLGERDKSQQAATRASARCPIYRHHPDLGPGLASAAVGH